MPVVGFSLVFVNHLSKDEVEFKYKTRILGEDHHSPMDEQTRKDMKLAFDFLAAGVERIMRGDFRDQGDEEATPSKGLH